MKRLFSKKSGTLLTAAKSLHLYSRTQIGSSHESISNREYAVKLNSLQRDATPLKLFKQTVENCYGYGKVGVALLDIQSYNQLCGKLETLFIKRLLWEDCLQCTDLCVSRNQRTFVRFQTAISCKRPQKAQGDQIRIVDFH